jgi:hypothetical protein
MELVCDFGGAGTFCDKGLNFLQLALIPVLKPRGVMENELWVAGEAERATDIMDPALIESTVTKRTSTSKWDILLLRRAPACLQMDYQRMTFRQVEWNTHQVFPIFVIDARLLCCVANSLKKCRLASIGPPDHEDTEMMVFLSKLGIGRGAGHCG